MTYQAGCDHKVRECSHQSVKNRLVAGLSPHVKDPAHFGLRWNFPQVARDREFNLFGSRLPRQRHELERGYCCFAHHAKRSNRFARTGV